MEEEKKLEEIEGNGTRDAPGGVTERCDQGQSP
jgi:hypothetical protein